MKEKKNKDRFFKVNGVLVCRKFFSDGASAMYMLDKEKCVFKAEAYYFDIFFRNSDWITEELNESQFKEAVIKICGCYHEIAPTDSPLSTTKKSDD